MKTSGMEVLCDGCDEVIPSMHPTALFITVRGPRIGLKKIDLHDSSCLVRWATELVARTE